MKITKHESTKCGIEFRKNSKGLLEKGINHDYSDI